MKVQAISGWKDPHVRPIHVPAVEEYEKYLTRYKSQHRGGIGNMTAAKLRRSVIMARQGESWRDIACAVGYTSGNQIKMWVEFLPFGMGL